MFRRKLFRAKIYLRKENNDEISLSFLLVPLKQSLTTKDLTGTRQTIVLSYSPSVYVTTR